MQEVKMNEDLALGEIRFNNIFKTEEAVISLRKNGEKIKAKLFMRYLKKEEQTELQNVAITIINLLQNNKEVIWE